MGDNGNTVVVNVCLLVKLLLDLGVGLLMGTVLLDELKTKEKLVDRIEKNLRNTGRVEVGLVDGSGGSHWFVSI